MCVYIYIKETLEPELSLCYLAVLSHFGLRSKLLNSKHVCINVSNKYILMQSIYKVAL